MLEKNAEPSATGGSDIGERATSGDGEKGMARPGEVKKRAASTAGPLRRQDGGWSGMTVYSDGEVFRRSAEMEQARLKS
jgi:hypothetical protein